MHSAKVAPFLLQSFVAAGFEGPGLIVAEAPMESASQTALCRFPVLTSPSYVPPLAPLWNLCETKQ